MEEASGPDFQGTLKGSGSGRVRPRPSLNMPSKHEVESLLMVGADRRSWILEYLFDFNDTLLEMRTYTVSCK